MVSVCESLFSKFLNDRSSLSKLTIIFSVIIKKLIMMIYDSIIWRGEEGERSDLWII